MAKTTRIVCISDTHLTKPKLPEGDILTHSGDLTYDGSVEQVTRALDWLGAQDFQEIILTPGNHDWLFQRNPELARKLCEARNITLLIDESITVNSIKFYGSPWQPEFYDWAFNVPRGKELADIWAKIPENTNFLLTHGPPFGILDSTMRGERVGCQDLFARVMELKDLQYHSFGHLHLDGGRLQEFNGKKFINASVCDERYKATNKIITVEYDNGEEETEKV